MSAAKLKNLIIAILLLVNLFLMALVVPARLEDRGRSREANAQLAALFANAGIELDPAIIPESRILYDHTLTVGPDRQAAMIAALLGPVTDSEQTENGFRFTSAAGTAQLAGSLLSAQVSLPAEDPEAAARGVLEAMGLDIHDLTLTREDGAAVCTVVPALLELPVVSHSLTLRFEDGAAAGIEGVLLPAAGLTRTGTQAAISVRDALVAFLGSRLSTGWMGSAIHAVRQGWSAVQSAGGSFVLRPVWLISTDMGVYLVDGMTRSVTAYS